MSVAGDAIEGSDRPSDTEILFEVDTPLGFRVRTTVEY